MFILCENTTQTATTVASRRLCRDQYEMTSVAEWFQINVRAASHLL